MTSHRATPPPAASRHKDAQANSRAPRPEARDPAALARLDHDHLWHPFTPMRQWRQAEPLIIAAAEGCELIDTAGRRYIDGVSSLWCNVHGHRVPAIDQAIRDQLDKVAHTTLLGLASPPSIELAAKLVELAKTFEPQDKSRAEGQGPGAKGWKSETARPSPSLAPANTLPSAPGPRPLALNKVFFSDAGATALEVAFKMAVGYWYHTRRPRKNQFIGLAGAYHGDTTASMSVGYSELFHKPFLSMVFKTHWFPAPDAARARAILLDGAPPHATDRFPSEDAALNDALQRHCLCELEKLLQQHAHRTAAIVIEPVMQGAAGMICQPPGFVRGVAKLARQYDVLLIADEVATGFGRTGAMFACAHEPITPDILCLAKGLTGGYLPVAATLCTDEIEQAFCGELDENKTLYHGHTYTANALGCAAALASIDLFNQPIGPAPDLLTHINRSAAIIADRLNSLRTGPNHRHILDIRQRGLMVGIELCRDRLAPAGPEPFDFSRRTAAALCHAIRDRGLIIRPLGDVIILMPIPAMPHGQLHRLLDIVIEAIQRWRF